MPEGWTDGIEYYAGYEDLVVWTTPVELRKLQVVFARVAPTGVATDPAVITLHFLNLTSSAPDSTWVDGDFVTVEDGFTALWAAVKSRYATGTILDQYRWYKDGDAFHPTPSDGNPAVRVVEMNVPGTASEFPLPPQLALSVTEKTALRKRWGRIYMPCPGVSQVTTGGMAGTVVVGEMANAYHTFYEACRTAEIIPVVFSPTNGSAYEIEHIQVDDLYDVIRSRRWKAPTIRETRNIID